MRLQEKIDYITHQAKEFLSPDLLFIILGPTASGKTRLAVELAKQIQGEIISADSRQVYRRMDIGTGKDLQEYGDIPYHLIDIIEPGEKYNVDLFRADFFRTYDAIIARGKRPILCGGTGSYIHSILQASPYSQIPKDQNLQSELAKLSKEELKAQIQSLPIPPDFNIDFDSHKRLVRALEILRYIQHDAPEMQPQRVITNYQAFGLNPHLETRRMAITQRLQQRLATGLIQEVGSLLGSGISAEHLIYYGLEYKYVTQYMQSLISKEELFDKLNTEIHRYAKRQMTYFRKMEKDGIPIDWIR